MARVVEIAPTSICCPEIADVTQYVIEKGSVDEAIRSIQDTYKNLKFFLDVVTQRIETLNVKIGETETTLKYVKLLEEKTGRSFMTFILATIS